MDKVLGIGNALIDAVVVLEDEQLLKELNLPKGSMQLINGDAYELITARTANLISKKTTGGSAANTILSLAHLGANPGFVCKVSQDANGSMYVKHFEQQGVNVKALYDTRPTGICTALVTPEGQRTMATYLGAAFTLSPADITPDLFKGYAYLYIEGYLVQSRALLQHIVELAKKEGLQIIMDLASYNIVEENKDFFKVLLKDIDIVFANKEECECFTGKSVKKGLAEMASICKVAVVKIADKGVLVQSGSEVVQVEAVDVPKVIDTTGAGDAFAAGFLYAYARNHSLERCAVVGNLIAGEIIQGLGANLDALRWDKVLNKVNKVLHA